MTTFALIRHAASEGLGDVLTGRSAGVGLTREGCRQARQLAMELRNCDFDQIYSSPLQRCRETAEAIAIEVGCPVQVEPNLNEIDFGLWTGIPFRELDQEDQWKEWNAHRASARPPQGESMVEAQARIVGALARWAQDHAGQSIAVVSHGDLIRAVVAHIQGDSLDALLSFEIDPASVTIIDWNEAGAEIPLVNGTGAAAASNPRAASSP